jgi:hypothetical protein
MSDDRCLLPHHRDQLIQGSGIAVEVIDERGYCSITPEQFSLLKEAGFTRTQWKNVPGLCLPLWTTDGSALHVMLAKRFHVTDLKIG